MAADLTEVLRQTHLLGSVPEADLAALAGASRMRAFRRGQVVCSNGDAGDTLILVISGRVKVAVRSADGGELNVPALGLDRRGRCMSAFRDQEWDRHVAPPLVAERPHANGGC